MNIQNIPNESDKSWTLEHLLKKAVDPEKIKIKPKKNMKYLILCGSTISGIGKGSTMSALGVLFQSCGLRVTCVKVDPYLNIDAGTMSPYEHGETFVLDDGGEVDLDLGNYERSLGLTFTKNHNITSGKVFLSVINGERSGNYLGKTVQIVPHVTDKIKQLIETAAYQVVEKDEENQADICLIEVGGTVGDLESGIFYEALRQFLDEAGPENCAIALITFVPELGESGEQKTKPTQFGIKELKSMGLFPNFIVCRSEHELDDSVKSKIAFGANLSAENIISCYNVSSIWDVPILLASQNFHFKIMDHLKTPFRCYKISKWLRISEHIRRLKKATEVRIAICGKYIASTDTYYSVMKSLQDAAFSANRKLVIEWLNCDVFDESKIDENEKKNSIKEFWKRLEGCNGILIPGGRHFLIYRVWNQRC
jgi:CTP synthase